MRAREPDSEGYVDRDGGKLHYEVFGDGRPTLLLLPAWTIIHARSWKAQVPYLARHFRVLTYDGPGNGRSDRALLVSLSMGAQWALWLTAHHPERVLGNVFIGPSVELESWDEDVVPSFDQPYTSTEGWARYNRHYWLERYQDFLEFFFAQCFPEPHSTKQVEDCVGWGLETTPQVLIATEEARDPDEAAIRRWCARVRHPLLVVHGDRDRISPLRSGAALARATGGSLVVLEGAGHIPYARDPVRVNRLIREFAESLPAGGQR
jgi:pimeloyl-ACP methyl ester carboxylesterase